jgi:hypothetical protein
MSPEPAASADPDASVAAVRRRRRTAGLAALLALLVWPGLLGGDLPRHRIDSLRVLGPLAPQAHGAGAGPFGAHRPPRLAYARPPPPLPNDGAPTEDAPRRPLASEQPEGPGLITLADLADTAPGQLVPAIFSPSPSGGPGPDMPFILPGVGGPSDTGPFVIAPGTTPPTLPPGQPPNPPVIVPPPGQPPVTPTIPPDTPPPIVGPPIVGPPVVIPPEAPPPIVGPPDTPPPFVGPPVGPPGPPLTPPGTSCVEAGDCPSGGGPGGGGGPPAEAVPEPALWAEMILGTLLAGAALRLRRKQLQPATALRARSRF